MENKEDTYKENQIEIQKWYSVITGTSENKLGKWRPKWCIETEWKNLRIILTDTLNNNEWKISGGCELFSVAEELERKIEERKKRKNTNVVEYMRLNNDLRRATDRAKERNEKIIQHQKRKRWDLLYEKTNGMQRKKNKELRTFGIED